MALSAYFPVLLQSPVKQLNMTLSFERIISIFTLLVQLATFLYGNDGGNTQRLRGKSSPPSILHLKHFDAIGRYCYGYMG